MGFAQLIVVWQELTGSKEEMNEALDRAGPGALPSGNPELRSRGGTLLYDAVTLVADHKLRRLPGRKTIILITDGEDNGSLANIAKAVKAAHEADAVIYGIHYVDDERGGRSGLAVLQKLAEPTGGRAFHVSGRVKLEYVFAQIAEDMRNQYGLGFTPPANSKVGDFHKLEVKTTKAGAKAQARNGYYTRK
ncbi:MAG: VWA domain-containing protein [Candidatus Solibacter sp.]